jgi:molecular chaperone HscC
VLSPEEVQTRLARLAALKIHPRDQIENLTLIARSERLYAECLGERREIIGHALARFRLAMERQEPGEIADERKRLTRQLDLMEEFL